jgi:LysM repeat protein
MIMNGTLRFAFALLLILTLLPFSAAPALAQVEAMAPVGSWMAQYWNGIDLSGPPLLQRVETAINHNWGVGSPGAPIAGDFFSARWTGTFSVSGGDYRLVTRTDDGVRVRVDNVLVIDDWNLQSVSENVHTMALTAGVHTFVIEYFENQGDAVAFFDFTPAGGTGPAVVEISPAFGPAGQTLQVHAYGFWRYAQVTIAVHPQGQSAVSSHVKVADVNGHVWSTVSIPGWATAGSKWVVIATSDALSGTSAAYTVGGGSTTSPCGPQYVVRVGDWFYQIARTCQVSVTELQRVNPQVTNISRIYPGQVLNIPAVGTPPPAPVVVTARTTVNLNFRTGPSTGYGIIYTIPAGTSVNVIARGPSGWIKVQYGGRTGWVAGWYCTITGNLGALPYVSI